MFSIICGNVSCVLFIAFYSLRLCLRPVSASKFSEMRSVRFAYFIDVTFTANEKSFASTRAQLCFYDACLHIFDHVVWSFSEECIRNCYLPYKGELKGIRSCTKGWRPLLIGCIGSLCMGVVFLLTYFKILILNLCPAFVLCNQLRIDSIMCSTPFHRVYPHLCAARRLLAERRIPFVPQETR